MAWWQRLLNVCWSLLKRAANVFGNALVFMIVTLGALGVGAVLVRYLPGIVLDVLNRPWWQWSLVLLAISVALPLFAAQFAILLGLFQADQDAAPPKSTRLSFTSGAPDWQIESPDPEAPRPR